MSYFRNLLLWCLALLFIIPGNLLSGKTSKAENLLQQAYYLENVKSDYAGAASLYTKALAVKNIDPKLKNFLNERLLICQEEGLVLDLTRLAPPSPLAYLEMTQPEENLTALLDKMGLLLHEDRPAAIGTNRLAISPDLVRALFREHHAAVAVTGIQPGTKIPTGVALIHTRDLSLLHGLADTLLPAMAEVSKPAHGFPIFQLPAGITVALTKRLVVVGSGLAEVDGVLERLKNPQAASLHSDPKMNEVLKNRQQDVMFFYVNAQPLLDVLGMKKQMKCRVGGKAAMVQELLDLQNIDALSGRCNIGGSGLTLELAIHRKADKIQAPPAAGENAVIDREALRSIPAGAAAALSFVLPKLPPLEPKEEAGRGQKSSQAAALGMAQMLLANISHIDLALLPGDPSKVPAAPIPDIVVSISTHQPDQLQALWGQAQGFAQMAQAGKKQTVEPQTTHGVPVLTLNLGKFSINAMVAGNRLVIASTPQALNYSLDNFQKGQSLATDAVYSSSLAQLKPGTKMALFISLGRSIQALKPLLPPDLVGQLLPLGKMLADCKVSLTAKEAGASQSITAAVTDIPDLSPLFNQMLTQKQQQMRADQEVAAALKNNQPERALDLLNRKLAENSGDAGLLRKKFDVLAAKPENQAAALETGEKLLTAMNDQSKALNNLAWALLTDSQYQNRFNALALHMAQRSNELTEYKEWRFVDTLARAEFENGQIAKAIQRQNEAIARFKDTSGDDNLLAMQQSLKRFQDALPKKSKHKIRKTK